ncbi:MAG: PIF1 family ATP-dependent DNA helicase [Cytophagales bacterium]|nr:AAA family ATPase [Bernardetiaceae bacterium]MDW8204983.1 PIF1 family ATP-dependent DNA helicase [Cytophagales bacterium]
MKQPEPSHNRELAYARVLLAHTEYPFFLTGKAGTGKSTFLREAISQIKKHFVVAAPTGIAAMHVGGVTLHSLFRLPTRPLMPNDKDIVKFRTDSPRYQVLKAMQTLIIDEASMIRADVMDAIDASLRKNLGNPLPFAGKQVLLVGDLFQLGPVVSAAYNEKELLERFYESPYFFDAHVFRNMAQQGMNLPAIELQQVYRQHDQHFINLLDKIRLGTAGWEEINELNKCYVQNRSQLENQHFQITLCSSNHLADQINAQMIARLPGAAFEYSASISGEFDAKLYPTDQPLQLKVGAQVMFIRNDPEGRWVNGTLGEIYDLSKDCILVITEDGEIHEVTRATWENIRYTYDKEKDCITTEVLGSFTQYPLRLAWAITIHKSQGLTFDKVNINLGTGAFAPGQLYVALSRCRTLAGITLSQKIHLRDVIVSPQVQQFAKTFNDLATIEQLLMKKRILPK